VYFPLLNDDDSPGGIEIQPLSEVFSGFAERIFILNKTDILMVILCNEQYFKNNWYFVLHSTIIFVTLHPSLTSDIEKIKNLSVNLNRQQLTND